MPFPDIELGVNGYCTLFHVESLNPLKTYNTTTRPTRVQVAQHINDMFHLTNSTLSVLGYKVPVSSACATATRMLQFINALGAASYAEEGMISLTNDTRSEHSDMLYDQFEKKWKMFRKGNFVFPAERQGNFIYRKDEQHPASEFHVVNSINQPLVFEKDMNF